MLNRIIDDQPIFDTEREALRILYSALSIADDYGYLRVSDLYELCGIGDIDIAKYYHCWTDRQMQMAYVAKGDMSYMDEWKIVLPKPCSIINIPDKPNKEKRIKNATIRALKRDDLGDVFTVESDKTAKISDSNDAISYKIGKMFALLLVTCIVSILVALTVKFIFWLF